ncbi:MAG: hypothetical protein RR563_05555 [Acinetobacter sp.]
MKSKVSKNCFPKYTQQGSPKLFQKLGQLGLNEIAKHDRVAVEIVKKQASCDQVVHVAFSELKSNYPETITSFVRCKNNKTFYVTNGLLS